ITHAIKHHLQIGHDIETGNDICETARNLSGTAIANIEPDRDYIKTTHYLRIRCNIETENEICEVARNIEPDRDFEIDVEMDVEMDIEE
ncbi:14922_t:CDS:2, partial [Gigaspora rosea]